MALDLEAANETDEDATRHMTLERFSEKKIMSGTLSDDQAGLYGDVFTTMQYLRRLQDAHRALVARVEELELVKWDQEHFASTIRELLPDAEEFLKWGCDAPEQLAEELLRTRARVEELEGAQHSRRCHICGKEKEAENAARADYLLAFHYDRRHPGWTAAPDRVLVDGR
jgi:hypothetical protein